LGNSRILYFFSRKGSRHLQARVSGTQELITVIVAVNASGKKIPPHLILKGKTPRALLSVDADAAPKGTLFSVSDSGWTKSVIIFICLCYCCRSFKSLFPKIWIKC
jgi:hypothetical protein